jgi:DNA-binding transcriptional MerR regulator/predicted transcriptional regulator YdeE
MERTETLLPIGRFSRLCGLTVKALRHYDDIHLLRPARVDESTGYRYYSVEQLAEAGAIARLRELDVPLEECRTILAERDPEAVRVHLRAHGARLEARVGDAERSLEALQRLLADPESLRAAGVPLEKVEVKAVAEQPILAISSRTTPEDLDAEISRSINGVASYMSELGAKRAGPPFTISSDPDAEGVIEVVIGWPTSERLPERRPIESRVLPSGKVAWAVYRGSYTELSRAYRALYEWIDEQGHEVSGDPREVYYTDPDEVPDPADYVTGIVWPVR